MQTEDIEVIIGFFIFVVIFSGYIFWKIKKDNLYGK